MAYKVIALETQVDSEGVRYQPSDTFVISNEDDYYFLKQKGMIKDVSNEIIEEPTERKELKVGRKTKELKLD